MLNSYEIYFTKDKKVAEIHNDFIINLYTIRNKIRYLWFALYTF